MHKPAVDMAGARSISDRRKEHSASGVREEANDPYSRQDAPHAPPSDPKAEVIINKKDKSRIQPHNSPPVDNGWYETPPNMPNEEDKSDGMNVGRGTEGEDLYREPAIRAEATFIVGQGEAPCPEPTPSKEATEGPKEQAQEETHNKCADTSRQAEHTNRDYPDVETFQERLEEERDQTEWLNVQLREGIQDRKRCYQEGFAGMDQQTYRDLQDRDKGDHRERKGIRAGLDWAMDILGQGEEGRAVTLASTPLGVNRDPSTDRPQRNLTHVRTPVEKGDLSCNDAGATDPQGQHQDLRRPLTSPGHLLDGRRPGLASGEVGAAAAEAEDMDPTDIIESKEEEVGGSLEVHVEGDN